MTLKLSKILVCTDFSSSSDEAISLSLQLQKKSHCEILLLHVAEFPISWDWTAPQYLEGRMENDLLTLLKRKLQEQQTKMNFVASEAILESGTPATVIVDLASRTSCDLIIMGHRGHHEKYLLGSLVDKIISLSSTPVLVTKDSCEIKKIAVLVDPLEEHDDHLQWMAYLKKLMDMDGVVLSLFPDITSRFIGIGKWGFSTKYLSLTKEEKNEITERLMMELKNKIKDIISDELKLSDFHFIAEVSNEKKLAFHLNHLLEEQRVDVVVMRKNQKRLMEKILIGSETRRMIEIFKKNILIIPEQK